LFGDFSFALLKRAALHAARFNLQSKAERPCNLHCRNEFGLDSASPILMGAIGAGRDITET
jgi:hypothetical protein